MIQILSLQKGNEQKKKKKKKKDSGQQIESD